jgi:hypothetical protein
MPMHPLIEVSTEGGMNMRGTCARVLAAALMTGAIATVVGMAALFGTPTEGGRPISAPPSSLQRSIRLTAHLAPRHRRSAPRLVTVHTNHFRPVRQQQAVSGLAGTRTRHVAPRPRRQLTSVPKPEAVPVPAPAVAPTPADPPPPVTYEDDDQGKDHGHGRGHAYGHDKQDE